MAYRTLLLHLDNTPQTTPRIEATLELATRMNARIVGLAPTGSMMMPVGFDMAPSGTLLAEWQDYADRQARLALSHFEAAARRRGLTSIEPRLAEGGHQAAVLLAARYADLIVVGQNEPGVKAADGIGLSPGEVVLAAPRPVLVTPFIGTHSGFGRRILIAWNGSREACRAVADAMPFLTAADLVTVMAVNPAIDERGHGESPGADLAAFLAHHGVRVEAQADTTPVRDIGEELLSRVADEEIDLLVMGAWGHSRAREWVLGGVTRTILSAMTVPVLMTH